MSGRACTGVGGGRTVLQQLQRVVHHPVGQVPPRGQRGQDADVGAQHLAGVGGLEALGECAVGRVAALLGHAVAAEQAVADAEGPLLGLPPGPRLAVVPVGGLRLDGQRQLHQRAQHQHPGVEGLRRLQGGRDVHVEAGPEGLEHQLEQLRYLQLQAAQRQQPLRQLQQRGRHLRHHPVQHGPGGLVLVLVLAAEEAERKEAAVQALLLRAAQRAQDAGQQLRPALWEVRLQLAAQRHAQLGPDDGRRLHERLQHVCAHHRLVRLGQAGPRRRPRLLLLRVPLPGAEVLEVDRSRLAHGGVQLRRNDALQQGGQVAWSKLELSRRERGGVSAPGHA